MNVDVKYFGQAEEITGKFSETIRVDDNINSDQFLKLILELHKGLHSIQFSMAVNQELVTNAINISTKDEVAILPPFAGG